MKYNETKYGVCWQLIEATGTVLSMFDKKISEATAENFKRENIDVHANTFVKEVSPSTLNPEPCTLHPAP
jgi:NADH dehydrogenase FAD-containing subunit